MVDQKDMSLKQYFLESGAKHANFSLSILHTITWCYPWRASRLTIHISPFHQLNTMIASSYRYIENWNGLVTLFNFRYERHIHQTKSSILPICSWCGFCAKIITDYQGQHHRSIQSFPLIPATWVIITFNF